MADAPCTTSLSSPAAVVRKHLRRLVPFLLAVSFVPAAVAGAPPAVAKPATVAATQPPAPAGTGSGSPPTEVRVGDYTLHQAAPRPASGSARALTASPAFQVTYHGFSPDQQAAFQRALDVWAQLIDIPVTIGIDATMGDLGEGILGGAGPSGFYEVPGGDPGVAYPRALADSIAGYPVGPGPAIVASFDVNAGNSPSYPNTWYTGTSSTVPAGTTDFESVVLHEIGHGLGFYSTADTNAPWSGCPWGIGCIGLAPAQGDWRPAPFDELLTLGAGGPALLSGNGAGAWTSVLAPNLSAGLLALFQSDDIYYGGVFTLLMHGGQPAKIEAPPTWVPGTSLSHVDTATYAGSGGDALMRGYLGSGVAVRTVGPMTSGMFADLGWHMPTVVDTPFTRFVDKAYLDFLGRSGPGDPTGETYWRSLLGFHRLSRAAFVGIFSSSPEWVSHTVDLLYQNTLGHIDPAGATYWDGLISSGQLTTAQVAALFYASPEYFSTFGGNNLATWVSDLYTKVLGRPASGDPAGASYWAALAASAGRPTVAYALYQSMESRTKRVQALFGSLLNRPADPQGLAYWASVLGNGNDVALAASLAGSTEYFMKAQP